METEGKRAGAGADGGQRKGETHKGGLFGGRYSGAAAGVETAGRGLHMRQSYREVIQEL